MKRVRVGDVLRLERRAVEIQPFASYTLIGVYSFGKGIFHRDPQPGSELGEYRFFAIEPGDLVLSNIQAWEGAIAYASDQDAGCIGTHRFLSYVPLDGQVDARYLSHYFLSEPGHSLIQQAAPGSVTRNRTLSIERFENLEIPLPDLPEQHRIVERLDSLQARTSRAAAALNRSAELSKALPVAAAHRPDVDETGKRARGWARVSLREVMAQTFDEVPVDVQSNYPNLGVLSFGRGLFEKPPIDGALTSAKKLFRLRAGQFVYSRLFAFEGAYALVEERFDGYYVSNEFPSFSLDATRVDPGFLAAYFRAPSVWQDLARGSKGLGVRRQRVQPEAILGYEVWLPPLAEQQRTAHVIRLGDASELQRTQMCLRLEALETATLNRAFAQVMAD